MHNKGDLPLGRLCYFILFETQDAKHKIEIKGLKSSLPLLTNSLLTNYFKSKHYVLCLVSISQCTPQLLLALNGFKQGFKVAFAKRLSAFALNDFKEHSWAVFNGFSEYLQQVSLVVSIY